MTVTERRIAFRELLAARTCAVPGSVFDAVSARIAQELGYPAGILGGSAASIAVLGAPDLMLLTLSELVEQTRRICRACTLPILVDGDDGYGNALNVRRTVAEIEAAGAAGVTIEDSILPETRHGGGALRLIGLPEALGKITAALDARTDPAFAIIARTSAAGAGAAPEAARRAAAFARAGADAVLVSGVQSRADLERITAGLSAPLILGTTGPALRDAGYLAEHGVRLALPGHRPLKQAIRTLYQEMLADAPEPNPENASDPAPEADALLARLTCAPLYRAWIDRFIPDDL